MSKKTEKVIGLIEKETKNYNFSSWRDDSMIHLDFGIAAISMPFKEFDEFFGFVIDTRNKHYNYFRKLNDDELQYKSFDIETTIFEDLEANQKEEDALKPNGSHSKNMEEVDLEKLIMGDDEIVELVIK